MLVKFLTTLLVLIYINGVCFATLPDDDDKHQVYFKHKKEYLKPCQSTISEESLIFYEDDWDADNQEIRMYKLCIAKYHKFMINGKIDVENIIHFMQDNFPDIQPHEMIGLRLIMTTCKRIADQISDEYDALAEFGKCYRRESPGNSGK